MTVCPRKTVRAKRRRKRRPEQFRGKGFGWKATRLNQWRDGE